MSIDRLSANVALREIVEGDLSVLFEHQRQPAANRMAAFPSRDRESFMEHWAKIPADRLVVKKAVLLEGELAGKIVSFEQAGER